MKQLKLFLLFIFVCSFCLSTIAAQDYSGRNETAPFSKFYFGASGGLTFGSMFGSGVQDIKSAYYSVPKGSGNAWLQFGYKPLKWLALESGAGIIGKGLAYNEPISGYDADYEFRQSEVFVEIPLLIKPAIKLPDNKLFFGTIGVSYAKQFSAHRTVNVSYIGGGGFKQRETIYRNDVLLDGISVPYDTMGGKVVVPYKDLYHMYDLSMIFGIGFEIGGGAARSNSLVIELKSFIGLIDQSYYSTNSHYLLSIASQKLNDFMIENHLTAEDLGIRGDGEYIENPVDRYDSFLISIGFKHYF